METDRELVQRSLNEDRSVFEALVHRHGDAIHAFLTRRAGRQIADELLTEVWLQAFGSRHSYNPEWESARPWLYGIARNTLSAHWRLRARRAAQGADMPSDPWEEVDDRLDALRQAPALRRALGFLAEGDREVLLLVTWEQLTPTEAAVVLGVPAGTARSRLHRARTVLRASFANGIAPATAPEEV